MMLIALYLAGCLVLLILHWRIGWRDAPASLACILLWPLLLLWCITAALIGRRR